MQKWAFSILCLSLGGCTSIVETHISNTGVQGAVKTDFMAAESMHDAESMLAHNSVVEKLSQMGMAPSKNARLRLDVAFATLPADIDLRVGDGGSTQTPKKRALFPRKSKHCVPVNYRLVIALTRSADGVEEYRSSATERNCAGKAAVMVPLLVKATVADLGKPKGSYVVERRVTRKIFD